MRAPAKARLLPALVSGPGVLALVGIALALGPVGAALAVAGIVAGELWSGAAWLGLPLGRRALRRSWGAVAAGRLTLAIGAAGLGARLPGLKLPGGATEQALWADVAAEEGLWIGAGVLLGALLGAGAAAALGHGRALLGWALPLALGIGAAAERVRAGGPAAATAAEVEESGAAVLVGPLPAGVGDWIEICADGGGQRPVAFARAPGLALRPTPDGAGLHTVDLEGLSAVACGPPGAAHAVARGDRAVWLLDAATLAPLRRLDHPGQGLPGALAVLPDGAVIVADDRDGSLRRYAPGAPTGAAPVAEHRMEPPLSALRVDSGGGPLLGLRRSGAAAEVIPIDPRTLSPAGPPLPVAEGPVAVGGGWLWDRGAGGGLRGRRWPGGEDERAARWGGGVDGLAVGADGEPWALDRSAGQVGGPGAAPRDRPIAVGAAATVAASGRGVYVVSLTGVLQFLAGAEPRTPGPPGGGAGSGPL